MLNHFLARLQLASNGLTIVSDAMILGLTIVRTIRISADARKFGFQAPITNLLLRDGTVYFVALTTLSTTNIIAIKMGPRSPIFGTITLFIPQLRGILVSRFFLNLRHVFFEKDKNNPVSPSSIKIKIPMIPSEDLVGNLGAPLRSSSISGSRVGTSSSGSTRQPGFSVGADPLLHWNADADDEDLEDVEISSHRPMLFGLDIDPGAVGEGGGLPLWRKDFDGVRMEGEEVTSLMSRNGKPIIVRTPVRSTPSHPKVEGDTESLPPGKKPSKSTVEEDDALLVDSDEDLDSPLRYPPRASIASTANSDAREVTPRRTSYFS
ncbi:hypothetical protein BJ322DRAFT_1113088 [Thelephora terrestris]|uniref:Uncharacterized protein n=1 Tax=Thelephora terrestris TaxID=56493 RepID=A0A9P6H5Q1_9AGAM|nr:hypothetical protein BJ322DRAFT_1113088 [Thelephora terrestris]